MLGTRERTDLVSLSVQDMVMRCSPWRTPSQVWAGPRQRTGTVPSPDSILVRRWLRCFLIKCLLLCTERIMRTIAVLLLYKIISYYTTPASVMQSASTEVADLISQQSRGFSNMSLNRLHANIQHVLSRSWIVCMSCKALSCYNLCVWSCVLSKGITEKADKQENITDMQV